MIPPAIQNHARNRWGKPILLLLVMCLFMSACSPVSNSTATQKQAELDQANSQAIQIPDAQKPESAPVSPKAAPKALSVRILQPGDNAVVSTQEVEVTGEAKEGTVLSINDEIVTAGKDRKFSATLTLDPGLNVIEITASDAGGNQATNYLTVTYEPQS